MVRLTPIDAVNNLIINDLVISQEDFDKDFIEIFLKYTLEGLPKKVLMTDGYLAYPAIIERICINHQLCIIPYNKKIIIQTLIKKINILERRNETLNRKINKKDLQINELKEYNKGQIGIPSKNDKTKQKRINKTKKNKQKKKI